MRFITNHTNFSPPDPGETICLEVGENPVNPRPLGNVSHEQGHGKEMALSSASVTGENLLCNGYDEILYLIHRRWAA